MTYNKCAEELSHDEALSELKSWRSATGFDDPEALSIYLSRETILQADARYGRLIADIRRKYDAKILELTTQINELRVSQAK